MVVFLLVHEDYNCNYSLALSTDMGGKIERKALTAPDTWHLLSNKTERAQWEKAVSSLRDKGPLYSSQGPKDVLTLGWADNWPLSALILTFLKDFQKSHENITVNDLKYFTQILQTLIFCYICFSFLSLHICVYIHIYNLYDYAYLYIHICVHIYFFPEPFRKRNL